MANLQLKQVPITKTGMLIRNPVADVFEAFVNPDITTKFWFTKGYRRTLTYGLCRIASKQPLPKTSANQNNDVLKRT